MPYGEHSPAWWQVVTPHKDIREKSFSEAVFAADLGNVLSNSAPLEYQDARTFFSKTYVTSGIKNLVKNVLMRLCRGKGDPVIQLQTPFGGGKTHSLLVLYHLINSFDEVSHLPQIKELLTDFPEFKGAKVAAFAGTLADPIKGRTPWGEIAYQLGCYEIVEEHDKKRVSPGKERIMEILKKSGPTLILIDELLEYIVKANRVERLENITQGQTIAFLQELTEAVSTADRCVLVLTLPASVLEQYSEDAEKALAQLQKVSGRVESIYIPVEGVEIYEVIRKRLFEDLGDLAIHRKVAENYFNLYQHIGNEVPTEVRQKEYRDKIEKAYPFHPELIDVLYERWGSFPTFQRTRGVLRLLAEIVADLYEKKTFAPLIQSSLIDLNNASIRHEFIKHIGNEYDSVVRADILNKATTIDSEMGSEYEKYSIARGLATATFLYSFSGGERRGITRPWLRITLLREGIPSTIVGDALSKLEDSLYYFHADQGNYLFKNQPNLNRIIVDREEMIASETERVTETVRQEIEKLTRGRFSVYIWPQNSADIPDTKNVKIILLPPHKQWNSQEYEDFAKDLIENAGTTFRVYRNTVFLVGPDTNIYSNLEKTIIRYLALKSIQREVNILNLSSASQDELEEKLKDAQSKIPFQIINTYRYILLYNNGSLTWKDMGIYSSGQPTSIVERVIQYLRQEEKLLPKPTIKLILTRAMGETEAEKSLEEIYTVFLKTSNLPCIESEQGLLEAVKEGVKNGLLGVRVGNKLYFKQPLSELTLEDILIRPEIAEKEINVQKEVGNENESRDKKRNNDYATDESESGKPDQISEVTIDNTDNQQGPAVKMPPKIKEIKIKAEVPWDKFSDIIGGVIRPLKSSVTDCNLKIVIELSASTTEGFDRTTIDTKVIETLRQIGAEIIELEKKQKEL
ncbi:ATPase [Caldicellulosiruptor acetigenus I77R1B]|uniref:ATPase n=1 Tax=Caldicellulosiruptor acetigenus (strain ATCC 700853 / DSM 12137 / I77R1B) TaxID=632335 RepID=E4SAN0_CALA7|nr:DUF499 domain-containing protein [Caldicellulosiruptor acetigenus]ADQ40239.1 ATPase [Caldicellulosiruptor acetigenus I77R1B]